MRATDGAKQSIEFALPFWKLSCLVLEISRDFKSDNRRAPHPRSQQGSVPPRSSSDKATVAVVFFMT
jgi:hypothetical protein